MDLSIEKSLEPHGLQDAVCHFERNYRFKTDQGIGQLALAIQREEVPLEDSIIFYSTTARYTILDEILNGLP